MTSDTLGELTVIIPTYKRQKYLERQVRLWSGTDAIVEILDGSPDPWAVPVELPPNIRYRHMPVSLEERFGSVASRIETTYATLLSDDEIYLPSALARCMAELSRRPELVACKGLAVGFNVGAGMVSGFQVYPELRGYRIDQNDPAVRMRAHMERYAMASLWAVMKRDIFLSSLSAMSLTGRMGSAAVGEIQVSLISAWNGSIHVVDELMWLRSFENENIWWASGRTPFHTWYVDPQYALEVRRFLDITVDAIDAAQYSRDEVRSAVIDAISTYVDACSSRDAQGARFLDMRRLIPQRAKDFVKRALARVGFLQANHGEQQVPLEQVVFMLERSGMTISWPEVGRAIDVIRRHSA